MPRIKTVGELKEALADFDDDQMIYVRIFDDYEDLEGIYETDSPDGPVIILDTPVQDMGDVTDESEAHEAIVKARKGSANDDN